MKKINKVLLLLLIMFVGNNKAGAWTTKKYDDGQVLYFDPTTGAACSLDDYNKNPNKTGNKGCLKWYFYEDDYEYNSDYWVILDHNTTNNFSIQGSNCNAITTRLESDTAGWKYDAELIRNGYIVKLVNFDDTFDINNYQWLVGYKDANSVGYYTDGCYQSGEGDSGAGYFGYTGYFNTSSFGPVSSATGVGIRPVISLAASEIDSIIETNKALNTPENQNPTDTPNDGNSGSDIPNTENNGNNDNSDANDSGESNKPEIKPEDKTEQITTENSDVKIHYNDGQIASGTTLSVKNVDENNENYKKIKNKITGVKKLTVYDINLLNNNQKVQPNGSIIVELSIPEGYNVNKMAVYRVENDFSLTKLKHSISNGKILIETNHFSNYVIAEINYEDDLKSEVTDCPTEDKTTTPDATVKNPETGLGLQYGILGLVILAGCGTYIYMKKYNKFPKMR